ncbi:hypothetical protein HDU86_008424 [Geranomyces michiganensis]|nr:hypothetical protein HDU86_008424 [Geranomyces michiganensis]
MPVTTSRKAASLAVLYASQTGNAEWIAKHIHEEALARGIKSACHVLDDHAKADLSGNNAIVLVASTTGDGDPPDNATKFWRWLRRAKGPDLEAFKGKPYAVLGLGDTNYSNFCNTAKRLDRRMNDLGSIPFTKSGFADDATGLEAVIDPWLKKLWDDLLNVVEYDAEKEKAFREQAGNSESKLDMGKFGVAKKDDAAKKATTKPTSASSAEDASVAALTSGTQALAVSSPPSIDIALEDRSSVANQFTSPVTSSSHNATRIVVSSAGLEAVTTLTGVAKLPTKYLEIERVPGADRPLSESRSNYFKLQSKVETAFEHTAQNPFIARISRVRCLTGAVALKRVLEIELDITGLGWEYTPGDAFAVVCPNPDDLVLPIISSLGLNPTALYKAGVAAASATQGFPFSMDEPVSVYEMFRYHIDLHAFPKKSLLRMLAEYTSDPAEKKTLLYLASAQGAAEYRGLKGQQPSLLDLLVSFPTCRPPLARVLENLPHLQPRYYSVASSPLGEQKTRTVRFAFNVVEYATPAPYNKSVAGLCSTWLDKLTDTHMDRKWLDLGDKTLTVPLFPKPRPESSHPFELPADASAPIVMIAAGTGISPFSSFLDHRAWQLKQTPSTSLGPSWLVHGCRFPGADGDALYDTEISTYLADGALTRLTRCHSRVETPPPPADAGISYKYVQHALAAEGTRVAELLADPNAKFYVCGSVAMAREVNGALATILVAQGVCADNVAAIARLTEMQAEGRYLRDLWT